MDILIKNVKKLLYDRETRRFYTDCGDICLAGGKILSLENSENVPEFVPDKVIDGKNKLAMPGLINAHTHTYMSVFRNCADDLLFSDWLFGRILPLEDKLIADDLNAINRLGYIEMLKTGTTACLDMHAVYGKETSIAAKEVGFRAVISRGLVDSNGMDMGIKRIEAFKDEINSFKNEPLISYMISPHAPYTCSEEYLLKIKDFLEEYKLPMNVHLSESLDEIENITKSTGRTPIKWFYDLGLLNFHTVAAHCVQLSDEDIDILKETGTFVAHCPKSNLKLGNGIAPVSKLIDRGVTVCIGTDSAASNNTLNMFSEMNFAALLQKGAEHDPCVMDAHTVLRCATVDAARALCIDSGEIAVGKNADIILLDTEKVQYKPVGDIVPALVYSTLGSEVETVIVGGNILMENRELTTIDEQKTYSECNRIFERINN